MTRARAQALIREWSERFRHDRLAAETVLALRDQADAIWRHAFALLQRESPEYRNSVDAEFARESKEHCNTLLRMIVAIAGGRVKPSEADPFDFVRTHAIWRARHQVPLIASLHAYRLAHRTYAEISRDALLRRGETEVLHSLALLSDFWIQFFDLVGTVLTEAHAIEDHVAAARESAGYAALIDDLMRGAAPRDADGQRISALCGIRAGAPLAVAIARTGWAGNGAPADAEVALRSFARLVDQMLPSTFGRLIDRRGSDVVIIACSETDTARRLAQALRQSGLARRTENDHAARLGVSSSVSGIADIPRAIEEARTALEFATDAKPVMPFGDIDLSEFLVRRADSKAFRLIPSWASRLHPTDADQSRELVRTIHTFADCSFNVKKTARRLRIHANTVYFRLNRIKAFTGVDPRTFAGTSLLLTALRLQDVGRDRPPS